MLQDWPVIARLRAGAATVSRNPLALVAGALLELVDSLLLVLVVSMLVEVAGRVRVVVAAVHAKRASTISSHQLLVASVASCSSHLLEATVPEVLCCARLAEPALVKGSLRTECRLSTRVAIAAFFISTGVALRSV